MKITIKGFLGKELEIENDSTLVPRIGITIGEESMNINYQDLLSAMIAIDARLSNNKE